MLHRFFLASLWMIFAMAAYAEDAAAPAAQSVPNLPAITVTQVHTSQISDKIIASGLIGPVEEVYVQPQIEGQAIDSLLADLGDRVEKGQPLAALSQSKILLQRTQLEATQASAEAALAQGEAQLTEARAAADEAVRVRDRTQALRADGASSQAALDQSISAAASALARVTAAEQGVRAAQAQIAVAQAQLADVELSLERATVRAPVAGEISARNASVGAIATAGGQPMFVLVREGLLELRADVAERDVLRLAPGQKVTLRVVGLTERLTGTVRLVEPTVDTVSRLGRVRITLDAPQDVRSGMFAEAEILVAEHNSLIVPASAVLATDARSTVLKVDENGVVSQIDVTAGIRDRGRLEIVSGLVEGDTIVARAGAFVRAGDTINPVTATPDVPSN